MMIQLHFKNITILIDVDFKKVGNILLLVVVIITAANKHINEIERMISVVKKVSKKENNYAPSKNNAILNDCQAGLLCCTVAK